MSKNIQTDFGLPERTLDDMRRFIRGWPEIERVKIYGSRAMGTHRDNSDIDVCVFGKDIDFPLLKRIQNGFESLPSPYKFDVTLYEKIEHKPLKEHIDDQGVDFMTALKMGDE